MRTNSIRRNKRGLASLSEGGGTPKGVPEGVSLNRSRALKFQRKAFSLGRRWPESIDSGRMWGLTSIRAVGEERTGSPPHPSRLAPCRPLQVRRGRSLHFRRGERLPLEGKLAQRQLRLMRSKLPIIAINWYGAVTFDLIRSGVAGPPSPPGEGFGRCKPAAPTAPHPSRLTPSHLPPGEGYPQKGGALLRCPTVHPLTHLR